MDESEEIFYRKCTEINIQYEETEKFFEYCSKGMAYSGIDKQEELSILKELENNPLKYSNDLVIDTILDYVKKSTEDQKLLKILDHLKVNNIAGDLSVIGKAYPKYYDDSYYIEIGRDIERKIRLLSDLFAVLFMYNEKLDLMELFIQKKLFEANLHRYENNEDINEQYNRVQVYMMNYEKNTGSKFTDKYVAYAREIYEMAIAFFLGHEIGHHYYDHTNEYVNSDEPPQIKELKADNFAFEFAFEYLKNSYKSDENKYGIHQFAGLFIPLIASSSLYNYDIMQESDSHPAIIKRMVLIQRTLNKLLIQDDFYKVHNALFLLCDILHFFPQDS